MENSFSHWNSKGVDVSQGPPKEREGDVMRIHGVINTPPVLGENAPSSSRQGACVRYPVHDLNPNCTSKNPNMTIIFFHGITYGIDDNWKQTWITRPMDDKEKCICWPQMWIPKDLNDNVKILSLSYDSNAVTSVHNDVTEIGRNLIQSLVIDSRYEALWDGPVAMVAYSFGGLVLKSLVVEMHKHVYQKQTNELDVKAHIYCEKFLKNLKGVVFYSVPHAGGTQDLPKYFKWQCQQIAKDTTPSSLVKNMESFNPKMEQLSIDFKKSICENINIYAFVEGLPIDNEWGILVPRASAIRLSKNNNYTVEDANHLTICKPPSKDHLSYSKLLECLKIFMKEKNTPHIPPLPCYEVALEDKAKAINNLLQKESIVALVGMGGIGKTTLSKKMYHLFHNQYEKSSFLEDVKSKHIKDVQKKLLQDLCDRKLHEHEDVDKYLDEIKQCMITKKVLVVVDDVDTTNNLGALQLLIDKHATGVDCKSKILVNCRNWQILKNHVKESSKVNMEFLEEEQARELFMFHAFKHANCVTNDFKNISMEIIKACGGLPLSLEILGCYLYNICDLEIWKDALCELKGGRDITGGSDNEMLWKTLRISYDHLFEKDKDMFLDIACFFIGFKKTTFRRVYWNADGSSSPMLRLQNLKDRSLIKWAEDGNLYMHEQLRDMGRNIATEVTVSRFIWKPNIYLQKNQVVEKLEGISFKGCEVLPSFFQNGSKEFHNLRLLDLTKASPNMVENFIQNQDLNNLRWLCLQECMIQKLPNNLFNCCHLQVLHLTKCNCLQFFFNILNQGLNMSVCVDMEELSASFSKLNALLELNLLGCSSLQELPTSIGQLNALQELNLSECSSLQKLPTSIGELGALQNLYLNDSSSLQELPTSIGQLSALQNLYLNYCNNLQELPTFIGQLNALQNLYLSVCRKLQKLPTSIGQLSALQNLDLKYCLSLQELPTSIGQLSALQNLDLKHCSSLQELPTSIGELSALQNLYLNDCSNLQELPPSIGQLNALQNLDLQYCSSLQELPTSIGQLGALQNLYLNDCSSLQELPTSIGQFNALQELNLS
ncbi:hypothetical protein BDL97_05G113200 [Sphagnum fallax]|nr:hypothetical protein BDL97_05G113200 [Sphagnum fallax]